MSIPTKFEDLDVRELRRTAVEDFAVPVEAADNKKSVLAALLESGVSWPDYVAQHPEVKPEEPAVAPAETFVQDTVTTTHIEREVEPDRGNVLTAESMHAAVVPQTAQPVVAGGNQPWLIKMTRENLRYDTLGYSFTKEHPYALVQPEDVAFLLEKEDGFRQAYPTELQEFYGT